MDLSNSSASTYHHGKFVWLKITKIFVKKCHKNYYEIIETRKNQNKSCYTEVNYRVEIFLLQIKKCRTLWSFSLYDNILLINLPKIAFVYLEDDLAKQRLVWINFKWNILFFAIPTYTQFPLIGNAKSQLHSCVS